MAYKTDFIGNCRWQLLYYSIHRKIQININDWINIIFINLYKKEPDIARN